MHSPNMSVPTNPELSPDADRWFVTNGVVAVGPVSFDLMTRGVAAGRIPPGSYVRHEAWKVWRRLEDIESLSTSKRQEQVELLANVSAAAEERASNPYNAPPPPPSAEDLEQPVSGARPLSVRPVAVDPVGVLGSALALEQAYLLALSTAVTAASAHVGLLHQVRADLGATVCAYAHGPDSELLLGERLAPNDPSLLAGEAGNTIVGEPRLGEAGRYIAGRLARCLPGPRGVAMVPLRHNGRLAAMFELGRAARPFRAREIARVEDVVDALEERIVVAGWID
jgi:hypothetical protein